MDRIEYLKSGDGNIYAYVEDVVVVFQKDKWVESGRTIESLESEPDSFNISSVEAMVFTHGVDASGAINTILATRL